MGYHVCRNIKQLPVLKLAPSSCQKRYLDDSEQTYIKLEQLKNYSSADRHSIISLCLHLYTEITNLKKYLHICLITGCTIWKSGIGFCNLSKYTFGYKLYYGQWKLALNS